MSPEQFYKQGDYPELDKHDKKAKNFAYYDLLDFADAYCKSKLHNQSNDNSNNNTYYSPI